jgi:hypothetical protein
MLQRSNMQKHESLLEKMYQIGVRSGLLRLPCLLVKMSGVCVTTEFPLTYE